MELLKVMSRLARPDTQYLPYFHLCRELGVRTVDGMVKGRVLDLRWTETVTKESGDEMRIRSMAVPPHVRDSALASASSPTTTGGVGTATSSAGFATALGGSVGNTPIDPPPPIDEEDIQMIPVHGGEMYDEVLEVIGPKLVPTTPIMRYAMRDVVQEYEDDQSVSEYASLSDVDEY